ncbi:MAG: hypothetical protein ACODAE_02050 [Gemmatimonadota bacterium]
MGADRSNPTAISGLFIDDPSFIETAVVNFVALNLIVFAVFLAGWVATRRKRRRERGEKRDGDG